MEKVDVSVIVVNYNAAALLAESLGRINNVSEEIQLQVILIDNASRDDSKALMQKNYSHYELLFNNHNVGFGRANNQALPLLKGRYVLLLNTDAFIDQDCLPRTIAYMEAHPKCGILGVRLEGRDSLLQPSCRYFPTPWNLFLQRSGLEKFFKNVRMMDDMSWDHNSPRQCDWVPGCFYLIRREVIDQVGLFDPRYFLYYEEVDHCFSTKKAGWEVHYFPDTTVVHIGGESAKSEGELSKSGRQLECLQIESELLYFHKNHGPLASLADMLLITLADSINFLKRFLKFKRPLGLASYVKHISLVWQIYFRTKFGNQPTR